MENVENMHLLKRGKINKEKGKAKNAKRQNSRIFR